MNKARVLKLEEQFEKTKMVRKLQKEFFKTRNYTVMNQSKVAEKELDELLNEVDKLHKEDSQENLFA